MTQPSEQDDATRGRLAVSPPKPAVSLSKELPLSSPGDSTTGTSRQSLDPKAGLSSSETRLPKTSTFASLSSSRSLSQSRPQSRERSSISSPGSSPPIPSNTQNDGFRQLILRSFAPRVAVYASPDTEELVRSNGFEHGLCSLLKPFGERLHGKVIIRDSVGGSRGWEDFSIRLYDLQVLQKASTNFEGVGLWTSGSHSGVNVDQQIHDGHQSQDPAENLEEILGKHLQKDSGSLDGVEQEYFGVASRYQHAQPASSPLYPLYLRTLLSSTPPVPYETFAHPVACMIAVSSHNPAPIEALRQLYANTGHGGDKIPAWVGTEYLRYYVLIHDEENDDIIKSTALFDLMKRHFGLHCHLLRLSSSQCVETDDDSIQVPSCEWLSAQKEVAQTRDLDYTDEIEITEKYIRESDVTAVNALLREMVVQSIVPFMEGRVMTWNDQVASRRRGISGRFMSLSKRWTGFSSNKSNASTPGGSNASSSNYNAQNGFYPPDTPEATMRQLADYAFMLRDWKLAFNTYDFIRTDFGQDKAWQYHAAANEMAAITSLVNPQTAALKSRSETVDQMLDTAAYSYLVRCTMPFSVNRCLTVAMELLRGRGPVPAEGAARWGGKLLEFGALKPIAQALITERVADCYMTRMNMPVPAMGGRRRQAALWKILACKTWERLGQKDHARQRLLDASRLYAMTQDGTASLPFESMRAFWNDVDLALKETDQDGLYALTDTGTEYPEDLDSNGFGESRGSSEVVDYDGLDEADSEGFTSQDAG